MEDDRPYACPTEPPDAPDAPTATPSVSPADQVIIELYERKARATAAALAEQRATIEALEAQVRLLQAERAMALPAGVPDARVAALTEERDALAAALAARTAELEAVRARAHAIVAELLDKALG